MKRPITSGPGRVAAIVIAWCSFLAADAVGQQLVEPHPRMPSFKLSNPRFEKDQEGYRIIKVDFERTSETATHAEVRTRVGAGTQFDKPLLPFSYHSKSGTFQVRPSEKILAQIDESGAEVFIAMELLSTKGRGPSRTDIRVLFKLSNSVTFGDAQASVTRPPNEFEKQRIQAWLEFLDRPADTAPSGDMELLTSKSQATPGLPIKFKNLQGEWLSGAIVDTDGSWAYFLADEPKTKYLEKTFYSSLAAKSSDLAKAKSDPNAFSASVMRVPETSDYLSLDWSQATNEQLVPGTPIKYVSYKHLEDGVIANDELTPPSRSVVLFDRDAADLRTVFQKSTLRVREVKVPSDKIYISDEVREALAQPGARERFAPFASEAAVLEGRTPLGPINPIQPNDSPSISATAPQPDRPESTDSAPTNNHAASTRQLKRYEITIPVPQGAVALSADTPLEPGIKLGVCYAKKWETVTVVEVHSDGSVRCNWDRWRNFTYDMSREDLIIAQEVLDDLIVKQASSEPIEREWSDRTGEFKITATYVDSKQGYVQLRKSDGELISVPISKLSLNDRKIILKLARLSS